MDGQDADALQLSARDGLHAQRFVPVVQKSVQVRRVALQVVRHCVKEGKQVRVLLLQPFHLQQPEQLLQQLVQRHQPQFLAASGQLLGQVVRQPFRRQVVRAFRDSLHPRPVVHHQGGQGHAVRLVRQVAQGVHQHAHRLRGIQPERLVRHHRHLQLPVKVVRYRGDVPVLAHQDGQVVHLHPSGQQLLHRFAQCLQRHRRIVVLLVRFQEVHAHVSPGRLLGRLLCHVAVGHLQFRAFRLQFLQVLAVQVLHRLLEHPVVEVYHVRFAPSVHLQRLQSDGEVVQFPVQSVQDAPVAVSPAVDGLLHVAHDQAVLALCQSFQQQQAEVVPLHAARVLELVNHHVADGRPYLFEDKRRVPLLHQPVQQGVRVRQQEAVLFPVQRLHLLVYVVQQLQLVQVLPRQAAAVHRPVPLRSQAFRLLQQRHQVPFRQVRNLFPLLRCLCAPVVRAGQASLQGGVHHVLVRQLPVLQFAEVAPDAPGSPLQVLRYQSVSLQFPFKLFPERLHLLQRLRFQFLQRLLVQLHHLRFAQAFPQSVSLLQVTLVEDVPSEALDFVRHVPALVVGDAFVDVVQQPAHHRCVRCQLLDEAVHRLVQYLRVVQFDVQVRAQLQFAGQVPHHRLEERVDCLHPEAAVVVQHVQQGRSRPPSQFLGGDAVLQVLADAVQVRFRVPVALPDAVQLLHDAFLHLPCRLVGEGHGQNLPVRPRVGDEVFDIFHGQGERLSRSGRCFVDK